MSSQKIEFLNIERDFDVEEHLSLQAKPESGRNTLELKENDVKCGEIFVSHSGKFTLICALCEEGFDSIQIFGKHLRIKHISCTFAAPAEIHPETSFDSGKQEVDYIDDSQNSAYDDLSRYSVSEPGADADDYQETENEPVSKWCCEICHRRYKSKLSLTRHSKCHKKLDSLENRENQAKNEPTAEPDASKRYGSSKLMPRIFQEGYNYLKCKYCSKEFLDRLKTLEHERTHDEIRPYLCPCCPKVFRYNSERKMHVNVHTGERPYKCSRCPRAFSNKSYLGQHMRTHLRIKKYVCEVCDQGFIRSIERTIHMRLHTGEKPYQCEECGMNFSANGQLWHHRKRHSNNKTHKCDVCGNVFYSNKHLKEHQIVHSDARPHECTECRRSFPRRKALIAHMKIHSDIKEYVCGICGKAFAQAAGLYSHKKSHGTKIVGPS